MWRTIALALLASIPATSRAQTDEDLKALLKSKDQALLDAIAPGDRGAWDPMLAPDFFYVDENMRIIPRAAYLRELLPLPKGSDGNIAIATYQMHRLSDTAIVVHLDNETEHYFGSELHAQYLMTETWQLIAGEWKLREIHCAAVPTDAPTISLTAAQLDELVGNYRAGSLRYTIRKDGNLLFGSQTGHHEVELKAETPDVLITPGQPRTMKVFNRDGTGRVTGFADRRENRDLVWKRF